MFENYIDDRFLTSTDKIAVGVSGGADSMLLLWALFDKQKKLGFEMTVVHVNHGIRKGTSERDQKFVEDFCKKRKINQISIKIDAKKCKLQEKQTLEEAARKLRYKAFYDVMKKQKLNKLFLAHHKNDQVETILMHIFRGSGIAGACGMCENETIFRPLINLSKQEILKICEEYHIEYVVDETNDDNDYARNFVRNKIMPLIEQVYPGATNNIASFGKKCEEIQNFIRSNINKDLISIKNDTVLLKEIIFEQPLFIVKEYVELALENLKVFEDIEAKHYLLITSLSKCEVNKKIDLPHKVIAQKTHDGIKFFKEILLNKTKREYNFVIGEIDFDGFAKIETSFVAADEIEFGNGKFYVDYDKISNNAVWRTRKDGDVFAKLGTGSKKLNDYFTDKKIDVSKRDLLPILCDGSKVLLVAGEDIGENVKIDDKTDKIVCIKFLFN